MSFDGRVMTLEEAMDDIFRQIQVADNLNVEMRQLASLTEQQVEEEDDFKESVKFETQHPILSRAWFDFWRRSANGPNDHRNRAAILREWFASHKSQRKLKLAQEEG